MNRKNLTLVSLSVLLPLCGCQAAKTSSPAASAASSAPVSSEPVSSEAASSSSVEPKEDDKVHIVILTGQSGARGKALNNDLTAEQQEPSADIDIAADGLMMPALSNIPETISNGIKIQQVKPGFGDTAAEFGPEMGMAETLASRYPKDGDSRKCVIVKYTASGSTFTDHWYSSSAVDDDTLSASLNIKQIRTNAKTGLATGPLTDNLYQLIDYTQTALKGEGYDSVIDGAVFVHGEQDAKFDTNMAIYEKALTYFIQDLRSYVGNDSLPFVITQALTNSAKYSNTLRDIQKRTAATVPNCSFIETSDLYTNTFEPWHFGPASNYVLGNRIAAELVSKNDNRKITSMDPVTIAYPKGGKRALPAYLSAKFSNNYSGDVKVTYTGTVDSSKAGDQEIPYTATTNWGTVKGTLTAHVSDDPYSDGDLSEYASRKKNALGTLGNIYVSAGSETFTIAAEINDTDLWTDGEAWSVGDMGQANANDDFRIFATTDGNAANRYTIALSSANLLRVYPQGTTLSDSGLEKKNMIYTKQITDQQFHVTTKGLVNDEGANASEGMTLELTLSYDDFGLASADGLKICFAYDNITSADSKKTHTDTYLASPSATVTSGYELDSSSYFVLSDLE
jgi:hypothetical protein